MGDIQESEDPNTFVEGTPVVITGLQVDTKFNGQFGVIKGPCDNSDDGYPVKLINHTKILYVLPKNLKINRTMRPKYDFFNKNPAITSKLKKKNDKSNGSSINNKKNINYQ